VSAVHALRQESRARRRERDQLESSLEKPEKTHSIESGSSLVDRAMHIQHPGFVS
jgi:hypothetical protein